MGYSYKNPDHRRVNTNSFYSGFNSGPLNSIVGEHFLGSIPGFISDDLLNSKTNKLFPKFNVIKDNKQLLLEAAIPGYRKEDIKVEIVDKKLVVSAGSKTADIKNTPAYLLNEFSCPAFSRFFLLPENLDLASVSATIDSGVLSVRIAIKPPLDNNGKVIKVNIV